MQSKRRKFRAKKRPSIIRSESKTTPLKKKRDQDAKNTSIVGRQNASLKERRRKGRILREGGGKYIVGEKNPTEIGLSGPRRWGKRGRGQGGERLLTKKKRKEVFLRLKSAQE